ncbi:hypothetical protein SDJN02_01364, partial [Cucurbita argyrosperma subsp. argyrosperma]
MGSGDYAGGHYKYASYVRQPRILDYSLQLKYPVRVGTWADEILATLLIIIEVQSQLEPVCSSMAVLDAAMSILYTAAFNYIGQINVWNPKVDLQNDFTTSRIWLKNGRFEKFESVEGGLMAIWRYKNSTQSTLNYKIEIWQKSGRCPKGTIPIRRVRKEDLLRANSFKNFGKKFPIGGSKLGAEVNRSVSKIFPKNIFVLGF